MKENKKPLLSICIPTYNREKYLKRLLDSIVTQNEFKNTKDVEIVISDNASTDWTKKMVANYIKVFWDKIKFFQNKENIWLCWNLYRVPSLWLWKYLWMMWSDEKLAPGSIWIILKWLENNNVKTVIITNSECESLYLNFNWFSDFSTYVWQHESDFLDVEWWFLTFMSFCIMSSEYYLQSVNFLKEHMDENRILNNCFSFNLVRYAQLYWNNSILYIKNYIIAPSSGAEASWTINRKIIENLLSVTRYIENNYFVSKSAKKVFKKVKKIRIVAYVALPFKKLCKLFHLENIYEKLSLLYKSVLSRR